MPDFNQKAPPLSVTNPSAVGKVIDQEYPRHVHKAPRLIEGGNGLTEPVFKVVENAEEKEAALADGWFPTVTAAIEAEKPARKK